MSGKDWLLQRLAQPAPMSDERWTWATVTTAGGPGLRVKLDGDNAALGVDVVNFVGWCAVGDRVRVHRYRRRLFVTGRKNTDTDWVDLDLRSGIAGQGDTTPSYRIVGDMVQFRGAISGASLGASQDTAVADLPAGATPSAWKYFPIFGQQVQYSPGCFVTSAGIVYVRTGPDVPGYVVLDNVRYPL